MCGYPLMVPTDFDTDTGPRLASIGKIAIVTKKELAYYGCEISIIETWLYGLMKCSGLYPVMVSFTPFKGLKSL